MDPLADIGPLADIEAHVANTQAFAALSRARFIKHIVKHVPTADRAQARTYWNSSKFKRVRLLFRRTLARLRKPRPDKIEPNIVANPGTYQIDVLYMDTDAQLDDDAAPAQDVAPLRSRMALAMVEIYSRRAYMVPIKGRSIDADILPAYKELLKQVEQHHKDMEEVREEAGLDAVYHATADRPLHGLDRTNPFPSFPPLPETVIYGIEGDKEFEPLRSFNDKPLGPSTPNDKKIMTDIYVSKWLHNAERQGGDSLGIIDAFARTIKHMVRTYALTQRDTQWKTYLPDLVALYNDSPHSGIHQLTPDFVSLHPGVMWKDMVDKAAHNDKVEDLLKDERPHHTAADVEALQGIRKRYNYTLPGPLKVGDFVMVLQDKQSILTKGPRRNKYQVFVVHTVLRRNRYQVVKLADVKDKQLALTDAQWPGAIEDLVVARVYAREELYKLSEEDKVNVDDGTVDQELRQADEDYGEAADDTNVADDDDDAGEGEEDGGGDVPDRFADALEEQADKLRDDGLTTRDALIQERKRLLRLHPIRSYGRAGSFSLNRGAFLRRLAVADAIISLGPLASDHKAGDYMYRHVVAERRALVSTLAQVPDDATPDPPAPVPGHEEVVQDFDSETDIRTFFPESVMDAMMTAYREVKAMSAADQESLAAQLGSTGSTVHMMAQWEQDKDALFRELAAVWVRRERRENMEQFRKVRKRIRDTFATEWGELSAPKAPGGHRKTLSSREETVPEEGGMRDTFVDVVDEFKDKSEAEMTDAMVAARMHLATHFGMRDGNKIVADHILNNVDARAWYVKWFTLASLVHTTFSKPKSFFTRFKKLRGRMQEWAKSAQGREPWTFDGFFEDELANGHRNLPQVFRDAIRTLYDRDGYDERSPSPTGEELQSWAEAKAQEMVDTYKFRSPRVPLSKLGGEGGQHIKALRGFLDLQVLWRAWIAWVKAHTWEEGVTDKMLLDAKSKNLTIFNDFAAKYLQDMGQTRTEANLEAALGAPPDP